MPKVFALILILSFTHHSALQGAQSAVPAINGERQTKAGAFSAVPVVYGTDNDGLPRRIKLRGVITEVSFVPFACGLMCFSGTAKIKLSEPAKKYGHEYAYIAILCFIGSEKDYLNKVVNVEATKLRKGRPRGCDFIVNTIDSQGVPFYRLKRWNVGES